jgi:hypothetical protein
LKPGFLLLIGLIVWWSAPADGLLPPVVLNGDASSLAFDPAFAEHSGGSFTWIWNSYQRSREPLFATFLVDDRMSRPLQLSSGAGVYSQPWRIEQEGSAPEYPRNMKVAVGEPAALYGLVN